MALEWKRRWGIKQDRSLSSKICRVLLSPYDMEVTKCPFGQKLYILYLERLKWKVVCLLKKKKKGTVPWSSIRQQQWNGCFFLLCSCCSTPGRKAQLHRTVAGRIALHMEKTQISSQKLKNNFLENRLMRNPWSHINNKPSVRTMTWLYQPLTKPLQFPL